MNRIYDSPGAPGPSHLGTWVGYHEPPASDKRAVGRTARAWVGYHETPGAGSSPIPCSLFPIPCGLRRITLPERTMVLSGTEEEGAGAKERRTKGKENSGTPLPPHPKTPPLEGWLSRQVQQNKQLDRHTPCTNQ